MIVNHTLLVMFIKNFKNIQQKMLLILTFFENIKKCFSKLDICAWDLIWEWPICCFSHRILKMSAEFSNMTMIITVKKIVNGEIHEVTALVTLKNQIKPSTPVKSRKEVKFQ